MVKDNIWKRIIIIVFIIILGISYASSAARDQVVIVVGSDPEGIAAAVSAARRGAVTILICHRQKMGGLMTAGALNTLDMNYGPRGELLTRGIFSEFFKQVEGHSFDIRTAENVFNQLISDAGVKTIMGASHIKPLVANSRVMGVSFKKGNQDLTVKADVVIDATQDGDFAYLAGVEFTTGMEDFGGPTHGMGATLIFGVEGVNWQVMMQAIREKNIPHTGASTTSAWGFWHKMQEYSPQDPYISFRGLNLGRQNDGSVLINAMYIFDFHHLCKVSREEARTRGKNELEYLIPFLRDSIPGFANATLSHIAQELYVRETRHMLGLYRLTIDDVLEHRNFPDKVALGSYPVDIQDISLHLRGFVVGDPKIYSIPFRCLIPQHIDGLLVVGRSASFDSLAHGSARVIPVGMAVGEAAGVAAYLEQYYPGMSLQQLAYNEDFISHLQNFLKEQGAYLPDFNVPYTLEGHWAYPALRTVRSLGLISAGYENNYRLDEPLSQQALQNMFNGALNRYFSRSFPYFCTRSHTVNLQEVARLFLAPLHKHHVDNPLDLAREMGLIPHDLPERARYGDKLDRATFYFLLNHYLKEMAHHL